MLISAMADSLLRASWGDSSANYGVRWVDGWLEPKLSRHGWRDEEAGIAVYMGDRVEFQNAFGAWQPHIYACFVDVRRSAVVNVTARPGRLP